MSTFDLNHKKIISAFLTLKNKAFILEKDALPSVYQLNKNNFSFVGASNFFTTLRGICDLSTVFMINEELSNVGARELCGDLLQEILQERLWMDHGFVNGEKVNLAKKDFIYAIEDISDLMSNRINSMVGSQMLDFTVSVFSCFENWITKLYDAFAKDFDLQYEESRKAKFEALLKTYEEAETPEIKSQCLHDMMEIRGKYRSFPDKINSLYKKVDKIRYGRDINHDKKIIEFLGARRNTVHNSGIHKGKPLEIECRGIIHRLETNKPHHSKSHPQSIDFLGELADIYTHMIMALDEFPLDAVRNIDGDPLSVHILNNVVNDSIAALNFNTEDLKAFLVRKFAMDEKQSSNFAKLVEALKKDKTRTEEEFNIYQILTCDLSDDALT